MRAESDPGPPPLSHAEAPPPAPGAAARVAEGVHWLRMPLPMELDHINLWLLDHDGGFVLVDTGVACDVGRATWERIEESVLRTKPLRLIVLTHLHPDHVGLAAWLQRRHGVPVWTSGTTEQQMRALFGVPDDAEIARRRAYLRAQGVADPTPFEASFTGERYRATVSGVPDIAHQPRDGEEAVWAGRSWRWLETNGHAAGHLCLHHAAGRVLIAGDQVLPGISPNVSLNGWGVDPNPLDSYLRSLDRLGALDPETLVLPSHGRPFVGLRERALELRDHHHRRLDRLLAACEAPRAANELLSTLYRRELKGFHHLLALGETLAHLEYLIRGGQLARRRDPNGIIRYVVDG